MCKIQKLTITKNIVSWTSEWSYLDLCGEIYRTKAHFNHSQQRSAIRSMTICSGVSLFISVIAFVFLFDDVLQHS